MRPASSASLAVRHVDAVAEANDEGVTAERDGRKTGKHKKSELQLKRRGPNTPDWQTGLRQQS